MKSERTPRSRVRHALRLLWMRSRERSTAMKNSDYRCSICGAKQTAAKGRELKLDVHHIDGVEWEALIDHVYETLLPDPKRLAPLCPPCHEKMEKHETKNHD